MPRRHHTLLAVLIAALSIPLGGVGPADASGGFRDAYRATLSGGGLATDGVGLARRLGGPEDGTIDIEEVPEGAVVDRAFLYWTVMGAPDAVVDLDGLNVHGTQVGRSGHTCWSRTQENFVFRADVTDTVAGNGSWEISGVGDVPDADGQGASLVVAYEVAGSAEVTTILIRDGAMSINSDPTHEAVHTFFVDVQAPATSSRLHVGVGDGQATSSEDPMLLGGEEVTAPDAFAGTDGPGWDDLTIDVPTSVVTDGPVENRLRAEFGDCLVWAYAALGFSHPDTDSDGDRLGDANERHRGTDPDDADTDGDLFGDLTEVDGGSDPLNPLSVPAPGVGPVTVTDDPPFGQAPFTDELDPLF